MLKYITLLFLLFNTSLLVAQDVIPEVIEMTTPLNADKSFLTFIKKDKFGEDEKLIYKGIADADLKEKLTQNINKIAKDFMQVSQEEVPTDIKYQKKIMFGLSSFNGIKSRLSKKDRQRVCHYIIELMDIIDLKSSKGQLMVFAYGFDAATLEKMNKAKNGQAK